MPSTRQESIASLYRVYLSRRLGERVRAAEWPRGVGFPPGYAEFRALCSGPLTCCEDMDAAIDTFASQLPEDHVYFVDDFGYRPRDDVKVGAYEFAVGGYPVDA